MTERRPNTKSKSKRRASGDPEIIVSEIVERISLSPLGSEPPMAALGRALDPLVGSLNQGESREFRADVLGVVVEITATAPPL